MTTQDRDDVGYWDALANRVAAAAAGEAKRNAVQWLAQARTGWMLTFVLVAGVLAFVMLAGGRIGNRGPNWPAVVAPADDVGKTIALGDTPPAIGALLLDPRARGLR